MPYAVCRRLSLVASRPCMTLPSSPPPQPVAIVFCSLLSSVCRLVCPVAVLVVVTIKERSGRRLLFVLLLRPPHQLSLSCCVAPCRYAQKRPVPVHTASTSTAVCHCHYHYYKYCYCRVIIIVIFDINIITIVIAHSYCVGRPGAAVTVALHRYLPVHLPVHLPVRPPVLPPQAALLSKGRQAR